MSNNPFSAAVIVAHPDDETLWAGGTILSNPSWNWFIISLCRGSDPDRAPKFYRVLKELGADGRMGDLDDSPEQIPLDNNLINRTIMALLPDTRFDLILTHNLTGEYTRHVRHEETARSVLDLWFSGLLSTNELWIFAYEDGGRKYPPRPMANATIQYELPENIWKKKYSLITTVYGFSENSFEAEATTRIEAFWKLTNLNDANTLINNGGFLI